MVMKQKQAEELRDRLVGRDEGQADVGKATTNLCACVTSASGAQASDVVAAAKKAILKDPGDLQTEALRVTATLH